MKFRIDRRRPPRRSHRGGDQDQEPAGHQDPGSHSARRRRAVRPDPAGADHLALPAARRARRPDHHHQRSGHRPAVGSRWPPWPRPSPTPRRICATRCRGGAVLRDAQQARRAVAQPAGQRQQGDRRAGQAQRPDRQAGRSRPTPCSIALERSRARAGPRSRRNISAVSQQLKGFIAENRADVEAGAGQAQRGADDRRQPQGADAGRGQAAQQLRDVAGRVGVGGAVLQGLRGQPAPRPVHRSRSSTRRSPTSASTRRRCCRRSAPTRRSASPAPRRCRCPTRGPARAASRT